MITDQLLALPLTPIPDLKKKTKQTQNILDISVAEASP